jgi:hypothetical protein
MRSLASPPRSISPPEGRARDTLNVECRPNGPAFCVWERGSALAAAARHKTFESTDRTSSSNRLIKLKNNRSIMPERERPAIKQNTSKGNEQ